MGADEDIKFMKRCLELANKALGFTFPNPVVGCVLVYDGTIIGEGYHLKAGGPHAEVTAIGSVTDSELIKSSVLYVNLEPCSHFGKTPPCADLIIRSGIRKIVIGTKDTSANVSGEGILKLEKAGCEVITGVLEKECRWINRRFFTFHEKKRPYIILKWAQSADGFIDFRRDDQLSQKPVWITGEAERVLVHKWRCDEQVILAGAGTIRMDNPQLNVRVWTGDDPVRAILSGLGNIGPDHSVFKIPGEILVFTYNDALKINGAKTITLDRRQKSSRQIADYFYREGIQSLFIEGGYKVLEHFISSGFWDEARIFYGKDRYDNGVRAPDIAGEIISIEEFSKSTLKVVVNEVD
jgi:diaminohydroxyphosphoribosylaminopyrimidine deaminase/5-amino-6-(5-phosphoribosylamino)uracil reductase